MPALSVACALTCTWTVADGAARRARENELNMRTEQGSSEGEPRPRYLPLFGRILIGNAVVLLAACLAIFVVLSPGRITKLATDEVLIATLCLVTLLNVFLVRRVVVPLQKLTTLARRVDPTTPGMRFPGASAPSEAGELALTFNEMLQRLEQERADSARSVLAAHESERLRVAQELHDEVGQTLTAVLLQLGRAQAQLGEKLEPVIGEAQEAVRRSLDDVRRIASELRPETLAELGLASALTALGDSFSRRTGIALTPHIPRELASLNAETELAVYRVAQEALTNIARHSGAGRADLTLAEDGGHVLLSVRDYGRGLGDGQRIGGNGIRGMRERAAAIGGTLMIGRAPQGPGSQVTLDVPVAAVR
jgi:two-component system sensor histidine kinase UhpB